jgi:hypothetical protein
MARISRDDGSHPVAASQVFGHGQSGHVDTTAEKLTTTSFVALHGVLVKAANANTGIVYVGNRDVTAGTVEATDGFELSAGQSVFIEIDDPSKVYVIASAHHQKVFWIAS